MPRPRNNSKLKTKNSKLVAALLDWFSQKARDLPWRRTRDPYAIWVSEIMLQQTQVKTVIPFWERWLRELPTVESLAAAPPAKIHKLWEGLGYYTRVRNMQKAAQQIVAQQPTGRSRGDEAQTKKESEPPKASIQNQIIPTNGGGAGKPAGVRPSSGAAMSESPGRLKPSIAGRQAVAVAGDGHTPHLKTLPHVVPCKFPDNFDAVLALPGVGRYTAGAICSIAYNQPAPILDGNVMRVLTRVFGIAENPKEKTTNAKLWQLAEDLVGRAVPCPPQHGGDSALRCSHLNQSLMELGALICTPRNPQCLICPVKPLCVAFREGRVEELPNLDKRAAATARQFAAFVVERDGKFLVRQRPAGVVNAHLWEFPNIEVPTNTALSARSLARGSGRGWPQAGRGLRGEGIFLRRGQILHRILAGEVEEKPFFTIRHSITRYRITLEAWRVKISEGRAPRVPDMKKKSGPRPSEGAWLTPAQLDKLAFTSAHRKILRHLLKKRL